MSLPSLPHLTTGQWFLLSVVGIWAVLMALRGMSKVFSLLILPGTALHETCHLAAGLLLFGGPKDFSIWPKVKEGYFYRGSVRFTTPQWWNRPFLGLAPVCLLGLVYLLFRYRADLAPSMESLWWFPLAYLAAVLLFSSMPSSADFKVAAENWVWGVLGCSAAIGILVVLLVPEALTKVVSKAGPALATVHSEARLVWKRL